MTHRKAFPCLPGALESKHLLEALATDAPAAFFLRDLEGRYVLANGPCREHLMRSAEAIAGKTDRDLFEPDQAEALAKMDRQVLDSGASVEADLTISCGGLPRIYHIAKWPVKDDSGALFAIGGTAVDITERKQADEELDRTQRRIETLVNSIDGIVWELDVARFNFTYVSPQAERLLGYPIGDWFATPNAWIKHLHPDDRDEAIEYCLAETAALRHHSFQYRMVAADGRVVWMRDIVTVVAQDGEPRLLRGVMVDVTEARRTEERLRESEQRLKEALRIGLMGYWEMDVATRQIYWSEDVFRLFERDPDAGAPDLDEVLNGYIVEEDRPRVKDKLAQAEDTGQEIPSFDARILLPSGSRRCYTTTIRPVVDDTGRVARLTGVVQDITERTEAEKQRRESERRLELALEGAELYLWELDLLTQRVEYSSHLPAFLGYRPDELSPTVEAWGKLVHPDDLPLATRAWQDHLEGKAPSFQADFRLRTRQGEWKWLQVRGKVVERDDEGRPLRIAGTNLDITQRQEAEIALRESEGRFRAAFEQAAVGMAHFSADGCLLRANSKFSGMVGYSPEELIGKHYSQLTHPDDVGRVTGVVKRLVRGEIPTVQLEKRYLRRDGSSLWGQTSISTAQDACGGRYLNVVCSDITERKESERRLQEAQSQLRLATSIASLGFWERDVGTDRVYYSPEWKKQLGYESDELPDRREEWESRLHPDDREDVLERLSRMIEHPGADFEQFEYRMRHKDGSYRWILARIVARFDERGAVHKLTGTHLDVTDRKEVEEKIRQASQHDPLTGLPNRALIYEFGEHLLAAAARSNVSAAVVFIDLDRFKPINDTYGHDVGDQVLKEVARRLGECLRSEDLVGRLGGDEFLAVLSRIRSDGDPARVAQNVLEALRTPCRVLGMELEVSLSIGISLYPQDGRNIDELIKNADTAMFHAKESSRNNYQFFRPDLKERVSEALRIENRLKRGLDEHEFVLFYQPVMDTESEAAVGVEALIRWPAMHIGPERFIPVAETAGFMHSLGEWVLREACRQRKEWRDRGLPPFPVAVNVSAMQFRQKDFFASVCEAIRMGELEPGDLQVEVTESAVMKNVDEASETLHSLRDLGVKVALDDFGTGYSSLSYLRWLPIDILKVDQSFVRNLSHDDASLAIANAIITLGDSLGLEIVAEGIESGDTADLLKRRHCRRGQGFHYCRPIPAREFEAWYRRRDCSTRRL